MIYMSIRAETVRHKTVDSKTVDREGSNTSSFSSPVLPTVTYSS